MLSKFKVWWIRNLIINWWISKINQIIYYQFFFRAMSFLIYKICIQPEFGLQSMTSVYISILWSRSPQTSSITYSQTAAWPRHNRSNQLKKISPFCPGSLTTLTYRETIRGENDPKSIVQLSVKKSNIKNPIRPLQWCTLMITKIPQPSHDSSNRIW